MRPCGRLCVAFLLPLLVPGLARSQSKESEAAKRREFYSQAIAELRSAPDEIHRFYALGPAAKESLAQGRDEDARAFAEELERLFPAYEGNWNYGNAVQDCNVVLGRLALKTGDIEAARKRLLAAGHSPGSPQMDSFGPNMTLARDLLTNGEKAVVLEYLELCKKFWAMEEGRLDRWKADVERGRMPNFGANLVL